MDSKLGTSKGFGADALVLITILLTLVILFVVGSYCMTLLLNSPDMPAGMQAGLTAGRDGLRAFNSLAIFFVVAMGIGLAISAFAIRAYPIIFAAFLLINLVIAFVAFQESNIYYAIFNGGAMAAEAAQFSNWGLVMQLYPMISVIISVIFAIAMLAKGGD